MKRQVENERGIYMEYICIDNKYNVKLERKRIKNINLAVLVDGTIRVSVPKLLKQATIENFIKSKSHWIDKQLQKYKNRKKQLPKEFVSGEVHYFEGKRYILNIICNSRKNCVQKNDNGIIDLYIKSNVTLKEKEKIIESWYKSNLLSKLEILLEKWEGKMSVKANKLKVRKMKTRWGSCNIKTRDITLNLELAKKDVEEVEYVLVHELTHLLEKYHNAHFKELMSRFLPDWEIRKKRLNGVI